MRKPPRAESVLLVGLVCRVGDRRAKKGLTGVNSCHCAFNNDSREAVQTGEGSHNLLQSRKLCDHVEK